MDKAQNSEEQSRTRSEIDVEEIQRKSNVIEEIQSNREKTRSRKKNQGVKSRKFTHKQRELI
jgi:hypothetical protein